MSDRKTISFFVDGVPGTAGSKEYKGPNRRGTATIVDSSGKAGARWRQTVAAIARSKYVGPLLVGPLELHAVFWMPRPKKDFKASGQLRASARRYPTVNPDTTKMFRALEDALTGILWKDDAQVISTKADKRYATSGTGTGATVSVREIEGGGA